MFKLQKVKRHKAKVKKYDVVSIGSALTDHFIQCNGVEVVKDGQEESGQALRIPLGAKLEIQMLTHEVGGGGANTAVAFSRLGLRASVLARLGHDEAAHFVRKRLESEGVHVGYLVVDPQHPTGESYLLVAADGSRTAMAYRGAGAHFRVDDVVEEQVAGSEWVYVSSIGGEVAVLRRIFALCQKHGVHVAWNPGGRELAHGQEALAPLLSQTDLFIVNREEAALLTGLPHHNLEDVLARLIDLIKQGIVVVTDGPHGAVAYNGGQVERLPGHNVTVVDATGAGDSFGSGFVGAHLKGYGMDKALSFAVANAESVIGKVGAQPGLLHAADLERQVVLKDIGREELSPVIG